jgi:thiamine biosynthesis lipoprotein
MILADNNTKYSLEKLHKWGFSFFIAICVIVPTGCSENNNSNEIVDSQRYEISGEAQGTTYHISFFSDSIEIFKKEVDSILDEIDFAASVWKENSIISRFNRNEDSLIEISDDTHHIFYDNIVSSKKVYQLTGGAYNPTVGKLVNAWGFGFQNRSNMDSIIVDSLMKTVGFEENQFRIVQQEPLVLFKSNPATHVDFNGIAQGYSVDIIANYFLERGVSSFMIEVGGELKTHGTKADGSRWKIGIDLPQNENLERKLAATLELGDEAVATSGSYRKFYEKDGQRFSHTIDPKTGFPVNHSLLSTTVVMQNCGYADAFATAFMVMGVDETISFVQSQNEFEMEVYLIYTENGRFKEYISDGLRNRLLEVN